MFNAAAVFELCAKLPDKDEIRITDFSNAGFTYEIAIKRITHIHPLDLAELINEKADAISKAGGIIKTDSGHPYFEVLGKKYYQDINTPRKPGYHDIT